MCENLSFSLSGTPITLEAGFYQARILTSGAALGSLKFHGHQLALSYDENQLAPGYAGKVLLPWPNRIRDGKYTWHGNTYQLPINDHPTGTALHGYTFDLHWTIRTYTPTSVTLECLLPATTGYPWPLQCHVNYRLDAVTGLHSSIITHNLSNTPIPYGSGTHPYLAPGGGIVDDWELQFNAQYVQRMDSSAIPVDTLPVTDLGLDFQHRRSLNGMSIDTGFTNFTTTPWTATVFNPKAGVSATLSSSAPWIQIYTGDSFQRTGIAVEPMSCPANAFNDTPEKCEVLPGQTHELQWNLSGSLT